MRHRAVIAGDVGSRRPGDPDDHAPAGIARDPPPKARTESGDQLGGRYRYERSAGWRGASSGTMTIVSMPTALRPRGLSGRGFRTDIMRP